MNSDSTLVTRFAPAPTGYLHMGHLLSAAFVWGVGRSRGAKILLRVEDHDQQRSRPTYEEALFEDLEWLGFLPYNWKEVTSSERTPYKQRYRLERYERLFSSLPTYFCQCSRKTINEAQRERESELWYPGNCREKKLPPASDQGVRLCLTAETHSFDDLKHGPSKQTPSQQCGDLLIRDRNGNYTYNFAVAIDDHDQGVNLIVRGDDLFYCTGRQLALHQMLQTNQTIEWMHHPLLFDPSGTKLSKRNQSEAVRERRKKGERPEALIGEALARVKIVKPGTTITAAQLPELFRSKF